MFERATRSGRIGSLTRRLRATAVLGVLLAALALGGCMGDDDGGGDRAGTQAANRAGGGTPARGGVVEPGDTLAALQVGSYEEGSFRGCVQAHVRSGVPIQEAINACNPDFSGVDEVVENRPSAPDGSPGPFGAGADGNATNACGNAVPNPVAKPSGNLSPAVDKEVKQAKAEVAAYNRLIEEIDVRGEAVEGERERAVQARDEALAKLLAPDAFLNELTNSSTGDPGKKGGGKREQDPNAVDQCNAIASYLDECNASGWSSGSCRELAARLTSCGDPLVTNPVPGGAAQEEGSGQGCSTPAVDAEQAERVVAVICSWKAKPAPGEDPCTGVEVQGVSTRYRWRLPRGENGPGTPCGDPAARTGEEQCLGTFTIVRFGRRDLNEEIAKHRDKLGGPIFVIPIPKPPGGGGGPQPGPKRGDTPPGGGGAPDAPDAPETPAAPETPGGDDDGPPPSPPAPPDDNGALPAPPVVSALLAGQREQTVAGHVDIGAAGSRLVVTVQCCRRKVIGRFTRSGLPAGPARFRVPLNAAGRRELARARALKVRLSATVTPPDGPPATARQTVALKR